MTFRLGQWPLAMKLWGAFAALTLLIFTLLAVLLPWTLKGFFTEQLYDILLDTQSGLRMEATTLTTPTLTLATKGTTTQMTNIITDVKALTPINQAVPDADALQAETMPEATSIQMGNAMPIIPLEASIATKVMSPFTATLSAPAIRHFTISGTQESLALSKAFTSGEPFMQAMEQDAFAQKQPVAKYTTIIDKKSIFYVIRKELVQGQPSFIVSYAWGNYRNDLVMTMFGRLMLMMVGLIVISWLPCLIIARYFTRPLVQMEQHVGRMAERDWHDPIETGRKDEVGRLAKAIEAMRQRLVRQDKAQQFFLQHTSHELKTPVMVIRSYAQSILDGVFPKGTLGESLGVILKEGERLEKRIRDLLLLNKLNYVTAREKPFRPFELHEVIEDVVERLRYRRPEIEWEIELPPATLHGDPDQWKIALENMLDNQLRYAKSGIRILLTPPSHGDGKEAAAGFSRLQISNDGPPLDQAIADSLFEPFRSGGDGQFGLGLAIVKQIMDHHGMMVRAANERGGVSFYLEPGETAQVDRKLKVPKVS
ncbi:HAMP domain-containing histidine kinase [Paenibacillus sp. CGMCC 1.16610]|uniref:histidine kinase n=1 Tax=Paenibacillus anseongense TaxID=2682845 RepID=A0ABW9UEL3_9BACL|nr:MULTISPECIES: HAMP domain-containing sensor histidine kinase [Paenibacillus]MBA2940135.1 HAMP domain-containing histidine kinase [Paenibacillus sp. CGMCC 1.16610]MVQ38589.1 HAMP domain-containing protein [Paenibacillus anseongense]